MCKLIYVLVFFHLYFKTVYNEENKEIDIKLEVKLLNYGAEQIFNRIYLKPGVHKVISCNGSSGNQEPIEWYSPSGEKVEDLSTRNTRIYVERKAEPSHVVLIIHSAKLNDSGNWTCKAGDLSETIEILVGEKVEMAVESEKMLADEGKNIKLICEAKGNPLPVVQWYKDGVAISGNTSKREIKKNDYRYSLEIKRLTYADAGEYMCKVTQKALSHYTDKTISLTVHHKPILFNYETREPILNSKYRNEEVFAVLNVTKNITCSVIANPPPTFHWYKRINRNIEFHIMEEDTIHTSEDGMISTMLLRMRDENDKGQYKCTAINTKGQVTVTFNVTPGKKPDPPDYISLVSANATYLIFNVSCTNCTFKPEENAHLNPQDLPVNGYSFQLVPHSNPSDWDEAEEFTFDIADPVDPTSVGPLQNSRVYDVRVRTRNAAGFSDWMEMPTHPSTTGHAASLAATLTLHIGALMFIFLY